MLEFELFGFLSSKTIFIILHLLGVALGAGGAYMSDFIYMTAIKDKRLNVTEYSFLKAGSSMVWAGIIILLISGLFLFLLRPYELMESTKFLAKVTVVFVIIVNGFLFHFIHLPLFKKIVGEKMIFDSTFKQGSLWIYLSGAISIVSWTITIILGSLRSVPYSYWDIMSFYIVLVCIAMLIALISRHIFLCRK